MQFPALSSATIRPNRPKSSIAWFLALSALDVALTLPLLGLGIAVIAPLLLAPALFSLGLPGFIGVRAVSTALIAGALLRGGGRWARHSTGLLLVGVVSKAAAVAGAFLF